jgi:hypothetical protein
MPKPESIGLSMSKSPSRGPFPHQPLTIIKRLVLTGGDTAMPMSFVKLAKYYPYIKTKGLKLGFRPFVFI